MQIAKVEQPVRTASAGNPSLDPEVHSALSAISATVETATTRMVVVFASAQK
jgi:hypothetical protein